MGTKKAKFISFFILSIFIIIIYGCPSPLNNNVALLEENSWSSGTIAKGYSAWYYFDAQEGNTYDIYWDDSYDGSGIYDCDVKVSAYHSDKTTPYFEDEDSAYNLPYKLTASADERIYLKVSGYSKEDEGSFAIKYTLPFQRVSNPYDNIQNQISENFGPGESWTFMIYIDGDNNLETEAIDDFNEIITGLNGLNNVNVKVIVLLDRIDGYSNDTLGEASDWDGARIYQINQNNSYTKLTNGWFVDGEEINMGDPETLKNFINYCKTSYSSDHYALILWNHGGGTRNISTSTQDLTKAICWDESSQDSTGSSDALYIDEVQQAVGSYFSSSLKLDFIGFDACLMGMVEVAYEFRNLAKVFAASAANEQGDGWDYKDIFSRMDNTGNNDPVELGKLIVKSYYDQTSLYSDQTMVAVDLTSITSLKTDIDSFASTLYNENKKELIENIRDVSYHYYQSNDDSISYPFYDLNDFASQIVGNKDNYGFSDSLVLAAQNVIDSLSSVIIAAYAGENFGNYYGYGSDVKRGLSIFISRGNKTIYTSDGILLSHYAYQWWYTSEDTSSLYDNTYLYGKIDFCDSNNNGTVETWRELFEAWYDSENYTPSGY